MPENIDKKTSLHPRNKHQGLYDFDALQKAYPKLKPFVMLNKGGIESIDFSDAKAVKALNKALLFSYYNLETWDIPRDYLCPPIPGRADYIHHVADLLALNNDGKIPTGKQITCLDIGVGSNCIYPIIGIHEYDWNFIGSEIDQVAIHNADKIRILNPSIKNKLDVRHQPDKRDVFHSILKEKERIDVAICNPPFHSSTKEALKGTKRKIKNLGLENKGETLLNFEGKENELTCEGGEVRFIRNMIHQSKRYADSILWFTSIVSKKDHLKDIYKTLRQANVADIKTISMGQGHKSTRFVAWTFHDEEQMQDWMDNRWI